MVRAIRIPVLLLLCAGQVGVLAQTPSEKTNYAIEFKSLGKNFDVLRKAASADHGRCLECHERLNAECEKWSTYEVGINNARDWVKRATEAGDAAQLRKARVALGEMLMLSLAGRTEKKKAVEAETTYASLLLADPSDEGARFDHGRALAWLGRSGEARAEFEFFLAHLADASVEIASKQTAARRFIREPMLAAHRMLPTMKIRLASGTVLNTDRLAGKMVIYDFWASWCGPCLDSIPKLHALLAANSLPNLDVLSISIDTNRIKWKEAVQKNNMVWAQALDEDGTLAAWLGVHTVPRMILVDADGIVVYEGYSVEELGHSLSEAKRLEGAAATIPKQS